MMKKKVLFQQDNASLCKSIPLIAKLHEFHFELLRHPPYSSNLSSIICCRIKKCSRNTETEAYFEADDKSFYKNNIEIFIAINVLFL